MTGLAEPSTAADHWTLPYRRGLMQWGFVPVVFGWGLLWLTFVVVIFGAAGIRGDLGVGELFVAAFFVAFGFVFALVAWRLGLAGVYVSELGVKVRSLSWSRTVPWSEVEGFSVVHDRLVVLRDDQVAIRISGGQQLVPLYPARLACLGIGDAPERACQLLESAREAHA